MKTKKILAVIITIALLAGLFAMTTATIVSAADTTVNFDQMACPSNDGMYLGYYCFSGAMADSNLGSINWGGLNHPSWYVSYYGPASNGGNAGVGPKSLYLNQGTVGIKTATASFTLPAGKVFKSIWAQGNGSVTISSPGNTSRTFTFASAGAEMTLETNWTTAAAVVTFSVTNPDDVWGTEFRNLVYGDPGEIVETTTAPPATTTPPETTVPPDITTAPPDITTTDDGGDITTTEDIETTTDDTNTDVPPEKGDINGDGKINAMDLLLMKQHILDVPGKQIAEGTDAFWAADMNDDSKINGMDLLLLKKIILK